MMTQEKFHCHYSLEGQTSIDSDIDELNFVLFLCIAGLSKFAKLARSVTRSRSVLASQFSTSHHVPAVKETSRQSNVAHVKIFVLCR